MQPISRRSFLHKSLAASSVAMAAGPLVRPAGASENARVRVAVMGIRGRGNSLLRTFATQPDVRITHLCDIDRNVLAQRREELHRLSPDHAPKTVADYRAVLDEKDVDALVIGTPDHWHALPTIHACQAGKDVYVEKPDGHNIREGQMMVAAARKYDRCIQMGTQARSAPFLAEAAAFIAEGGIGKALYGKAWESARQGAIPRVPDSDPPDGVDYDRWLGPAPERPFNRYRFHGNWRWFFDYGCGDLGNDGVHRIDYARMVMGIDEMPHTITCAGGKLFFDDAQEWPDTMVASFAFGRRQGGEDKGAAEPRSHPDRIITYEMRIWSRPKLHGLAEGAAVYGENGWVLIGLREFQAFDHDGKLIKHGRENDAQNRHVRNFLDCVKSRDWQALNQEIHSGHISSVMCHTGNIAWRTGQTLHFDAETETFDDPTANGFVGREYRKGYGLPDEV